MSLVSVMSAISTENQQESFRHRLLVYLLLFCSLVQLSRTDDPIASKQYFKETEKAKHRCPYSLRRLWQAEVSSFPFAAAPLISDINGDGKLDVVAAPFGETLTVVHGESGKHLHNSGWPQHNLDKSIHSSPVQFDIDGDGILDILFMTSKGEGLSYNADGIPLHSNTFQLGPAYVKSKWYEGVTSVNHRNIQDQASQNSMPGYIPVDLHVFDTPVLHEKRYLVIPLSFFFSDDDYTDEEKGPWGSTVDERNKYYITGVAILDLQGLKNAQHDDLTPSILTASPYYRVIYLEIEQKPVVHLFSPTVVDIDGDFSSAEIVAGTSSGSIFLLSWDGQLRSRYPQTFGSLSSRISVAELDASSPGMELVVTDMSGNVSCLNAVTAKRKWVTPVGGSSISGASIVDVNNDGQLDVVVATKEGYIFSLNGATGEVMPKYPYKASKGISGNVLVTKFKVIRGPYDLVFLSDDGILHILASDHSCESQIAVADTSLVSLLLHDLSPHSRGLEVLVATADGSLICLGSGQPTPAEELASEEASVITQRLASPGTFGSDQVLSMEKIVVRLEEWMRAITEATGSTLDIFFTIHRPARKEQQYNLKVYIGSELVHQEDDIKSNMGIQYVTVNTPPQPGQGQVTLVISDKFGQISEDSIYLKFNQLILLDLQWLVLSPFIAMIIILLVNHGFPAKDLLPVTFPFKSK